MVELSEAKGNSSNNVKLQLEVTYVLKFALFTFITLSHFNKVTGACMFYKLPFAV